MPETIKKEYSLNDYQIKTLDDAKKYLRDNIEKGTICPCCAQNVKLYKRNLYKNILKMLVGLYNLNDGYHHVDNISVASKIPNRAGIGDFAKLKHWGFISEKENDSSNKRTSGEWKIEKIGIDFVLGKIKVPKKVYLYNNKILKFSTDNDVYIYDILENFHYKKMMNDLN